MHKLHLSQMSKGLTVNNCLTKTLQNISNPMGRNDKAVCVRITHEHHELLQQLAEDNHTSVSTMVGAFCEACCEIIDQPEGEVLLPKYLALCRLNKHYKKGPTLKT